MSAFDRQGLSNSGKGLIGTAAVLVFLLLTSAGCSSSSSTNSPDDPEAFHIKKVAALILEFEKTHDGNPPADIEQLKSWAVQNGKAEDKDFLSTRDKESYVFAVSGGGKPKKGSGLIVHEAKGHKGMVFYMRSSSSAASQIEESSLGYITGQSFKGARPGTNK